MKNPEARRHRLLIQDAGEELVLYDQDRHRAHRLNRAAALVWQNCDGVNTVADLTTRLRAELSPVANEKWVWQALGRLGKAHLLKETVAPPAGAASLTRRQLLGSLPRTAALLALLPVVATMLTPSPLGAGPPPFDCDENPCVNACKDMCKSNADCPPGNPVCRVLDCQNPNCPCPQRRCTKEVTPP
jgi:hypothetical protein